jgi:hypothetical protein
MTDTHSRSFGLLGRFQVHYSLKNNQFAVYRGTDQIFSCRLPLQNREDLAEAVGRRTANKIVNWYEALAS